MFMVICIDCGAETVFTQGIYKETDRYTSNMIERSNKDIDILDDGGYEPEGIKFVCSKCGNEINNDLNMKEEK